MESITSEVKKICFKCGTDKTSIDKKGYNIWRFYEGKRVCRNCFDSIRWFSNKEKESERHKKYYYKHQKENIERRSKYYHQNKEILNKNRVQRYREHRLEENAVVRSSRRRNGTTQKRRRIALILLLGGKCVCCAYYTDVRALCVDHKFGSGNKERKRINNPTAYYTYYLDRPEEAREKLQVLCCNCNIIKMTEEREYFSRYNQS